MGGESNLARRIARERNARGWSARELTRRVQVAGCKVPANTVTRIEARQRGVSVDELIGLSQALGLSVDDLLTPLELVDDQEAQRLLQAIGGSMEAMYAAAGDLMVGVRDLAVARDRNGEVFTYVIHQLKAAQQRASAEADELREMAAVIVARIMPKLIDEGWEHGSHKLETAFEPDPDEPGIWRQVTPFEWGSEIVPHRGAQDDEVDDAEAEPLPRIAWEILPEGDDDGER